MKKCILSAIIGALCMLLVLYCIAAMGSARKTEVYEHTDFLSDLPQEKCFLCGDVSDFSVSTYWGEDNVGILNLNTFELLYLEINRYDDQRQLVEEPAGYVRWDGLQGVNSQTYPDNGYAHVRITGAQYAIDRAVIQSRLCQSCLDTVNGLWFCGNAPAEFAVISFADRTIRPLLKSYPWFSAGDYGVACEFKEDGTIDLLIHHCPNRYAK